MILGVMVETKVYYLDSEGRARISAAAAVFARGTTADNESYLSEDEIITAAQQALGSTVMWQFRTAKAPEGVSE